MLTILSLCDFTGEWSRPYREAGYDVRQVDIKHGDDIRLFEALPYPVRGVLAAPPCTHFSGSGARWWSEKGSGPLLEGLALVDAVMRLVVVYQPSVWVIENPVGRLPDYLGPCRYKFNPNEFAGWADDPNAEAYTKLTCLWGRFDAPEPKPVEPALGSMMHRLAPSSDRADLRSVTPQGFARAFAAANPAIQDVRMGALALGGRLSP